MNEYDYVINELIRQGPKYYFIYFVCFASILINTVYIYIDCKNQYKYKAKYILLFCENIFLTLALLVCSMINVLAMDAIGQNFYDAFNSTNNNLLLIVFAAAFLCLTSLIIIIYYGKIHKSSINS